MPDHSPDPPVPSDEASLVVEDQRFAVVPEWVIDAPIPDSSLRLYALLLRYGGTSGSRMPSRPTLARRMHRSVDAVDRALRELVSAGMVRVEHRRRGEQYLSNRYHVRTSAPLGQEQLEPEPFGGRRSAATPAQSVGGGRVRAATPGRTAAATLAAQVRPDPEASTQSTPPPPPASSALQSPGRAEEEGSVLKDCGIADGQALADLSSRCSAARMALGQSTTRWATSCLTAALTLAVRTRGWPAAQAVTALLAVAADPSSRSPMRVAEAGPWWDELAASAAPVDEGLIAALEQRLDDLGGHRPALQARARAELKAQNLPLNRSSVVQRACDILDRTGSCR